MTNSELKVPSIAVIVPNWNDSHYIKKCLHSVFSQDVLPDEIIIVDDKSTDDSVKVIRDIISDKPNVLLIECDENAGTFSALNRGLSFTKSDYVLFLSANDYLLPGIFARAKSCLSSTHFCGLWSAMVMKVDENGNNLGLHSSPVISTHDVCLTSDESLELVYRVGSWFMGTTLIFHRETLSDVGGLDPGYGGLADLMAAFTVAGKEGAAFSPLPLGVMRIHGQGYLEKTLKDSKWLDDIINRIKNYDIPVKPQLFRTEILLRMIDRIHFAAIRSSHGKNIHQFINYYTGYRKLLLQLVEKIVSQRFALLRIMFAFMILRPFDVIPSFWHRYLGSVYVRIRMRKQLII